MWSSRRSCSISSLYFLVNFVRLCGVLLAWFENGIECTPRILVRSLDADDDDDDDDDEVDDEDDASVEDDEMEAG